MSEAVDAKDKELETLRRENAMLKNERDQLKEQVREATDAFKDFTAKEHVREEVERKELIDQVAKDSDGKLPVDALDKMSLSELYVAKMTLDKTRAKSFASVIAAHDAELKKPKPVSLTVGQWDPVKKDWTGGM